MNLLCLCMYLVSSIPQKTFNMKRCWILPKALSESNEMIMCFFFFQFVYMVNYIDEFSYIEPPHPCIPDMKPTQSWWIMHLMCFWIQFVSVLLNVFVSMSIREISLKFSFFVESLYGLGIRVTVAS